MRSFGLEERPALELVLVEPTRDLGGHRLAVAMSFAPSLCAVPAIEEGEINRDKEGDEHEKLDQDSHEPASNLAPAPISRSLKKSAPSPISVSKNARPRFRAVGTGA
jgi:hypothetical protein